MALITCPECGSEVSDKAAQCPKCGYPLINDQSEAVSQHSENTESIKKRKLCWDCGKELPEDRLFRCSECSKPSPIFETKDWLKGIVVTGVMIYICSGICSSESDSPSSVKKYNTSDDILTDDEFKYKPFDELSEEEKRQAVDRIADDLEESGVDVRGRYRDRK